MAKKKDEKDVLVVRDEKTGEISVVAGLNADGTPKRTPAKAENAQSFLQFDRHGDVLDNFSTASDGAKLASTQTIQVFNPLEEVWNAYTDTRMGATIDAVTWNAARSRLFPPKKDLPSIPSSRRCRFRR